MTDGPAAGISEVLTINDPRRRNREDVMEDPHYDELRYDELRYGALNVLYKHFAHHREA